MSTSCPPCGATSSNKGSSSVMIEKFTDIHRTSWSEFLDLNHTRTFTMLVSLLLPKFALGPSNEHGRTSEAGH